MATNQSDHQGFSHFGVKRQDSSTKACHAVRGVCRQSLPSTAEPNPKTTLMLTKRSELYALRMIPT